MTNSSVQHQKCSTDVHYVLRSSIILQCYNQFNEDNDNLYFHEMNFRRRKTMINVIIDLLNRNWKDDSVTHFVNENGTIPVLSIDFDIDEYGYLLTKITTSQELSKTHQNLLKSNILGQFSDGWCENGFEINNGILFLECDVEYL